MPGFIDAHRRIMGGNAERWFSEQSAPRMQELLESGYTTLMSGGGPVAGMSNVNSTFSRIDSGVEFYNVPHANGSAGRIRAIDE